MKKPNIPPLPRWAEPLAAFVPGDAREAEEQRVMLETIARLGDAVLTRESALAHMTASSIIVSPDRRRTLMAFHRIYQSWAWTGGHADGETDLEQTARREAAEETGIRALRRLGDGIASMEILPVWAHVRRGREVGSHLHLNVSYLFEADDTLPLRTAPDENSAVGWIEVARLSEFVSEPPMLPVYRRLLDRANNC
ncbi:MAG: NUDIX hydrolase [Clostridiales bacterium]|nr:NUDIX hydrolase [Clostridiales bacterium]MDY5348355.1 NUDIX hydrolase [Candidatus Ventricola sp.]MDY5514743.1 NUDIX hydrolase [Candidatus Ventricola sp.]